MVIVGSLSFYKYKYSGEENLSTQVFMLPNMHVKKQKVQADFPNGLTGFLLRFWNDSFHIRC